jgi:Fic family protein
MYQDPEWPQWRYDAARLALVLAHVRHRQGRVLGQMANLGFALRAEASLVTLIDDVVQSSAIEGEVLDRSDVRSSIARRLGIDVGGVLPASRNVEGIVEMMLDATQNHAAPLTAERLFGWHAALFPTGRSGMHRIHAGAWRSASSGRMQVVSGPIGRETVHFEAPEAARLESEMAAFLAWFNAPNPLDPVLKAGLAHLWFVTIHPFDDGNGRIARAIADMALARADGSADRFYSMSSRIEAKRHDYYRMLEATQKGDMDVTDWLLWFLSCLDHALTTAETTLADVLLKSRFWEHARGCALNDRQTAVLTRLLDGFEGYLTSRKYAMLAKCSADTALRDIQSLIASGLLMVNAGGGRSSSYRLVLPDGGA